MYIIAEVGQAHEGSLGIAHSYIDALSDCGIDAVKFQTHIAEAESSLQEPFRVKFSYEDVNRFDYWKRMEFTSDQWLGLKNHCAEVGLDFISSPFSIAAVELLENMGVTKYKIGSGEVNNFLMLSRIADTNKEVLLSSGMSSFDELDKSVHFLKQRDVTFSILQCTTSYPTIPEEWGLNVIPELEKRYKVPIGFSDHSGDIYACIAASMMGAQIVEFHVVFDKKMFGPDSQSSLTINQIKQLTKGLHDIEKAKQNPMDKNDNAKFKSLKKIFEKSLAVNRDISKGEFLSIKDLEAKKPSGEGIPASRYEEVIGKRVGQNLKKWEFLKNGSLDE